MHNADINISFNPLKIREVDEAKLKFMEALRLGRKVLDEFGSPLERFDCNKGSFIIRAVETGEDEISMRIFDKTGDRRLIWNWNDPAQIKEAMTLFKEYSAKGWKGYAVGRDGKKGQRVYGFDPSTHEIIFDEKGTREKLANFVKKFSEVKLLPKTFPG